MRPLGAWTVGAQREERFGNRQDDRAGEGRGRLRPGVGPAQSLSGADVGTAGRRGEGRSERPLEEQGGPHTKQPGTTKWVEDGGSPRDQLQAGVTQLDAVSESSAHSDGGPCEKRKLGHRETPGTGRAETV